MKINSQNISIEHRNNSVQKEKSPNFKGAGTAMLSTCGQVMDSIEKSGFVGSFLIQDGFGMTVPRTGAGFTRDREHTGEFNFQEGFEVLGREGLSGPSMMAVAPISFYLTGKLLGKYTAINSQLIKHYGNNQKEFINSSKYTEDMYRNPEKFKDAFYEYNIEKTISDSLGKEHATKENVAYLKKQIKGYENVPSNLDSRKARNNYKNTCKKNIVEFFDNIRYKNSDNLDMLQKVEINTGKPNGRKAFSTISTFDAMIKYTDDIIKYNKKHKKIEAFAADKLKYKALCYRLFSNIATMISTVAILSVLPKIYASSKVAPGAVVHNKENESQKEVTFKGNKKPNLSVIEKLGKKINDKQTDFMANELEYNGHNFTNTLMTGLSIGGLIAPRCKNAYDRALVDEYGKKDLTEIWETCGRDIPSTLSVVFAVPMLTRMSVTSYENKSGYVLMHKDRSKQSLFKTILDCMNPYSKTHVLTNSEINSLYNNIDSKEKMINFCKYIDKNNGDLEKIISTSDNSNLLYKHLDTDIKNLKKLSKSNKNSKIISTINNLEKSKADKIIVEIMKAAKNNKSNKIATLARGLNSVPAALTTFIISPYLLGWVIPKLTYKNTRRIHEKQAKEREERKMRETNQLNVIK